MFYPLIGLISSLIALPQVTAAPMANENSSARVHTVYEFPNGTWAENLAVRPDGSLLITTLNSASLYLINPADANPQPVAVATIPAALGVLGITEIQPDVYAVVAGNVSTTVEVEPHSFAVWRVSFHHHATGMSSSSPQTVVSPIAAIPQALFLDGITMSAPGRVLVSDSYAGAIWGIDLRSGAASVVYRDALLAPRTNGTNPSPFGVNGVRARHNTLYFTNTAQNILASVGLNAAGIPAGKPTALARPLNASTSHFDDFALDPCGGDVAYLVTQAGNSIERFAIRSGGGGSPGSVVAGCPGCLDMVEPTSAAFGRAPGDTRTLYVTTGGGLTAPLNGTIIVGAQVVAIPNVA